MKDRASPGAEGAAAPWERLLAILEELYEIPAAERPGSIARLCGGDARLEAEVRTLLAAGGGGRLETPAPEEPPSDVPGGLLEGGRPAPRRIGAWELLSKLGEGGMGAVYLGSRADGEFEMRVAIKLIRAGFASREALDRFRRERQVLANLEHPGIARLVDGGTTGDGLPYLVMEHVQGEPLNRYCDSRRLTTRERLALFLRICEAVDYAHRNLVVHRDLKPSNILVTPEGVPKLLDFGIAKVLGEESLGADATRTTLMTPAYASPEQVRGRAITTSSDVYSLGVILYGLLTGRSPHRITSGSALEIERAICEEEPERPSTVVATPAQPPPDGAGDGETGLAPEIVSGLRRATPAGLRRELSGDLDWIVMTALRKEAERRYASVAQLHDDVRSYLAGLPVAARPDTLGYRAGVFLRRNRAMVAAVAAIFAVLVAALAVTAGQRNEAIAARNDEARARDRSDELLRELLGRNLDLVFEYALDLHRLGGGTELGGRMIGRSVQDLERLAEETRLDPETQVSIAEAHVRLAYVLGHPGNPNLGDARGAREQLEQARALLESLPPADRERRDARRVLVLCETSLGDLDRHELRFDEGRRRYDLARELCDDLLRSHPDDPELRFLHARLILGYAHLHGMQGETEEARRSAESGRAIVDALLREDPADSGAMQLSVEARKIRGAALYRAGDYAAALEDYREAARKQGELLAGDPGNPLYRREAASLRMWEGSMLQLLERYDEAEAAFLDALAGFERLHREDPASPFGRPEIGNIHWCLGSIACRRAEASAAPGEARRHWEAARESYARGADVFAALIDSGRSSGVPATDLLARMEDALAEVERELAGP